MSLTGAAPPPPGVVPDFDNPVCDRNAIYLSVSICTGVATICFAARAFTKYYVIESIDIEDYLLILGWLFTVGFEISVYLRIRCGLACHQWDITTATMTCFKFRLYITNILYVPTIIFIKLSILFQLKRIFASYSRGSVYWTIVVLMVVNTLFYLIWGIDEIFYCQPIAKSWDPAIPGTCQRIGAGLIFSPIVDFVLNLAMLVLPIWILWKLNMKIEKRVRAALIFTTGVIGCLSGAFRVYYAVISQTTTDVTYNYKGLTWATALELSSGIVIASIPVLPRLFSWFRTGKRGASRSSRRPSASYIKSYTKNKYRNRANSRDPFSLPVTQDLASADHRPSDTSNSWIPLEDGQLKADSNRR